MSVLRFAARSAGGAPELWGSLQVRYREMRLVAFDDRGTALASSRRLSDPESLADPAMHELARDRGAETHDVEGCSDIRQVRNPSLASLALAHSQGPSLQPRPVGDGDSAVAQYQRTRRGRTGHQVVGRQFQRAFEDHAVASAVG